MSSTPVHPDSTDPGPILPAPGFRQPEFQKTSPQPPVSKEEFPADDEPLLAAGAPDEEPEFDEAPESPEASEEVPEDRDSEELPDDDRPDSEPPLPEPGTSDEDWDEDFADLGDEVETASLSALQHANHMSEEPALVPREFREMPGEQPMLFSSSTTASPRYSRTGYGQTGTGKQAGSAKPKRERSKVVLSPIGEQESDSAPRSAFQHVHRETEQPVLVPEPSVPSEPAVSAPPRRKPGRRRLTGLIAGGVAVVVLVVAGVVAFTAGSAAHAPQTVVASYLDALKGGNIERALQLGGVTATSADVLLTNKAYQASADHITAYTIQKTVVASDTATITTRISQGPEHYTQEFQLEKTGKDLLVFDQWKLAPVTLGNVGVSVNAPGDADVTIDGATVKPKGGFLQLRAFPGSYSAALSSTENYTAKGADAHVRGFGSDAGQAVTLDAELTPAGEKAGEAAVNSFLTSCLDSTELAPAGCPFKTYNTEFTDLRNEHWVLGDEPTFTIGEWNGTGWQVSTTVRGSAKFSAIGTDSSGESGPIGTDSIEFGLDGAITGFDGGVAVYSARGTV